VKQRCRGLTPALTATAELLVGLEVSPSRATEEPVKKAEGRRFALAVWASNPH